MGQGYYNFPREMAMRGHAERVIAAYNIPWVEACQGLSRLIASPQAYEGREDQDPDIPFVYPFICPGFLVFLQDGSTIGIGNYFKNLLVMISQAMRTQGELNRGQIPSSQCMDQQVDTTLKFKGK